jgi:hypothetical protein
MSSVALAVYAASWVVLFLKFFLTALLQARTRMRTRVFRYAEDAAFWHGRVGEETEPSTRAQQLLFNDGEVQTYYLALGGAYLALGAWPAGAPYYFGAFVLSRLVHAYCLLRPRQPLRNRAYVVGIGILLALASHIVLEGARLLLT